jgi:hypothetical protein
LATSRAASARLARALRTVAILTAAKPPTVPSASVRFLGPSPTPAEREQIVSELLRLKARGLIECGPLWYDGRYVKTRKDLYEEPRFMAWAEVRALIESATPRKAARKAG